MVKFIGDETTFAGHMAVVVVLRREAVGFQRPVYDGWGA
jgi:hypothetical protein